jgi:hypothetical protein
MRANTLKRAKLKICTNKKKYQTATSFTWLRTLYTSTLIHARSKIRTLPLAEILHQRQILEARNKIFHTLECSNNLTSLYLKHFTAILFQLNYNS